MSRSCQWVWIGDKWSKMSGCAPGMSCSEPGFQGSYSGETASTSCS